MKLLEGKTTIITGGSRGIGKGIAKIFAEHGSNVAFTYSSSKSEAEALETELTDLGIHAKAYQSDASDFQQAQDLVEAVVAEFGSVDVLINNAGITKDNLLMRISESDFDRVIEVNLKSVFNMTKAVQRSMLKQRHGSIINMSSVVGVKGNAGQTNYSASKAAVATMATTWSRELAKYGIRAAAIAPGVVHTPMAGNMKPEVIERLEKMIPVGRMAKAEEIAQSVKYIFENEYFTGRVLEIDGGLRM